MKQVVTRSEELMRLPKREIMPKLREKRFSLGPDDRSERTIAKIRRLLGVNILRRSSGQAVAKANLL